MSTIPDNYKGAGYGTIYSDSELRQAIANTEVANLIGNFSIKNMSTASSLALDYTTIPSTSISQLALYVDAADGLLKVRTQSNGNAYKVAYLDLAQQYTAAQGVQQQTLSISNGVVSADLNLSNKFTLNLTNNVTNFTATNLQSGTYIFNLIEDSTGGRTLIFDTTLFKFPDGGNTAITTTANKRNKVVCDCDGTRLDCTITVFS